jgi:hypothetical protein
MHGRDTPGRWPISTRLGLDDGAVQMVGMAIDETVNPGESHVWLDDRSR